MKKIITLFTILFFFYTESFSQCNTIYVTPSGSGSGTKASPASFLNAISTLATTGDHIKMDTGLYVISNPITSIPDNIILEGGFVSSNNWNKVSVAGGTRIHRDNSNVQDGGLNTVRISAFELSNVSGFRFQDITIEVDNAPAATNYGVSVYGIYLSSCSNYNVVRCQVLVGDASKGADGTNGNPGASGSVGSNGQIGYDDTKTKVDGGAGGAGGGGATGGTAGQGRTSDGSGYSGGPGSAGSTFQNGGSGGGGGGGGRSANDGGYGGNGGGVSNNASCPSILTIATNTSGGNKGNEDACNSASATGCVAGISGTDGADGADGADGCDGAVGAAGTKAAFYNAGAKGSDGIAGQGGQGGKGGGGGAGEGGTFCTNGTGAGGGGGGGGGQGGFAGTGAFGGGSTYAVYLYNNGVNSLINDCFLSTGAAGLGGNGGLGGAKGVGRNGGIGGTIVVDFEAGCGGDGGKGGDGGAGGDGGDGSPGEAMSIYVNGTALTTQDVGFNLAAQPVIVVEEKFCAGDSVNFTALAAGLWSFGATSTVATATGTNVATTYKQGGRKDITYNGQAYAGFASISNLSPSLANAGIDSVACTSITLYADSVLTGSGLWNPITPGVSVTSPTVHNSSVNLVAGLNELEWVVSFGACCPPTRDTVRIWNNTPPTDPVSIYTIKDTICYGDSSELIVTGGSLGTDGVWTWYRDSCSGTPVGFGDTVKFSITSNRTYYVRAESSCGNTICVSKALTVNPISVAADSIISSTDTLCRYDSVILTAIGGALLPGDEWNWYESSCGGIYVGTGTSIVVAPVNNATYFVRGEGVSCKATPCVSKIIYVKGAVVSIIPYDTICGVLQPMVLNNANPIGGVYSGTGVSNGTFDPVVADYGNHVITYTYTDQASGCVQALYDTLVVSSACADIEKVLVVNTFSPNGDGRNDTWNVNLGNYSKSSVTIFNKWGTKIYESKERIIQWDGTSNGKPLPSGSYFYVIEIDDQEPYTGSITIVR